jgi:hypothetical protein
MESGPSDYLAKAMFAFIAVWLMRRVCGGAVAAVAFPLTRLIRNTVAAQQPDSKAV